MSEQASLKHAKSAFRFLTVAGFKLTEKRSTGGDSLHDGWRLTYQSREMRVTVEYFDYQFEVRFRPRGSISSATYLAIDRELFDRRSGFGGNMFHGEKLAEAIDRTAADIEQNYSSVLAADPAMWSEIQRRIEAAANRRRHLP
jgi:hypothetical protein